MARFSIKPETKQRILKGVLFSGLFFFGLLFFVYLTFPWDRLVSLGVRMAEERAKMSIEIKGFSPSFGTGVVADQVTITTKPPAGDKEGTTYQLDNVSARISLLSLLTGSYELSFEGELLGGSADGVIALSSANDRSIDVELSDIDLAKISLISGYIGLPVQGRVGGKVDLSIPGKGLRFSNGNIGLHIDNGKVGEKGAKLDPSKHGGRKTPGYDTSITLQDGASLGTFVCNIDIKDGKGEIKEFGAGGGDVEASMNGSIILREGFVSSVLSGVFKFRFNEEYVERNKMALFLTAPDLASAKTEDGFFAFNINDPLNKLKFKPSKRDGVKANPAARAVPGVPTTPGVNDATPQVGKPGLIGNLPAAVPLTPPEPEALPERKPEEKIEEEKKVEEEKKPDEKPDEEKKPEDSQPRPD